MHKRIGTLIIYAFDYDRNGNRTGQTFDALLQSYGYTPDSNQLNSDPNGSVQHDPAGNRTSDQGGNRTFEYNDTGRLYKVYEAGQLIATYIYNAQGQRTRKITSAGTNVYHYDVTGNLIAETTDSGQALKDYVYVNSVPVAQIDTTVTEDVVHYLHTDHLGTPRRATNAVGEVTWSWDSDAFGTTAANDDVDNDGIPATINVRFAGQYFDAETSLHYNYFRYYSPAEGRYVTSDPIGLNGGLNTYGYVGGNPLFWVDMYGLQGGLPTTVRNPVFRDSPWHPRNVAKNSQMWREYFQGRQQKIPNSKIKKPADNVPTWAKGERPFNYERPTDFAKRLCDDKLGPGKYDKGPGSPYNQIKKWGSRHFKPSSEFPSSPAVLDYSQIPDSYWFSDACYEDGLCS